MVKTYHKFELDGYIIGVATSSGQVQITADEYNKIIEMIHNTPQTDNAHCYRLRSDTLEWDLCELHIPEDDEEATIEDYQQALAELGVK